MLETTPKCRAAFLASNGSGACKRCILRAFERFIQVVIVAVDLHMPYTRGIDPMQPDTPMEVEWEGNMQSRLNVSRIALKTVVLLSALMIGTLPGLARDPRV